MLRGVGRTRGGRGGADVRFCAGPRQTVGQHFDETNHESITSIGWARKTLLGQDPPPKKTDPIPEYICPWGAEEGYGPLCGMEGQINAPDLPVIPTAFMSSSCCRSPVSSTTSLRVPTVWNDCWKEHFSPAATDVWEEERRRKRRRRGGRGGGWRGGEDEENEEEDKRSSRRRGQGSQFNM